MQEVFEKIFSGDAPAIMAAVINALPDDITCLSCLYGGRPDEDGYVECRRWPPEVYVLADGTVLQLRARMHPLDGCGEHISGGR